MARRVVTEQFSVSPQLGPDDLAALAAAGVVTVINHRPEGEAPDQPSGAVLEAAARAAGLRYVAVPVRGAPTDDQARETAEAAASGPTHAWCRSGTRSIMAWAKGEALAGRRTPDELVGLGADAGYDLRPLFA